MKEGGVSGDISVKKATSSQNCQHWASFRSPYTHPAALYSVALELFGSLQVKALLKYKQGYDSVSCVYIALLLSPR